MTLMDNLLNDIAKSLNSEAFTPPSHAGWSSTAITIDATDTSLVGEFGVRSVMSPSRTNNEVTWSGIRSGAIASSSGDRLNSMGLFNSSTGSTLHAEALISSLLHTSDFDVELDWIIRIDRRA